MAPQTPYTADLGDRDPLVALGETTNRIGAMTAAWNPAAFERTYAPGKWTARQILIHLAQCELMFGTRVRLALATPNYVAQNMDQDAWMTRDTKMPAADALQAFLALARMNRMLFESLSDMERALTLGHPEYGSLSVDWIIHQTAGHQIHHLKHLEVIAAS